MQPPAQASTQYVLEDRFLPRPELQKFRGNPLEYWTFIRGFDIHVASKLQSDERKLLFLIQHCESHVRVKLEHFAKKPIEGYRLAREWLYKEYGQPHVIANACELLLKSSQRVRYGKPQDLEKFSEILEKCLATLEDINEFSGVNSLDNMMSLIEKLPGGLQHWWVERSVEFRQRTGYEAKFEELVQFVCERAEIENSLYGRKLYEIKSSKEQAPNLRKAKIGTFNVTSMEPSSCENVPKMTSCPCCEKLHALEHCRDFKNLTFKERVELIRQKSLCFKCLLPGHFSK